MKIHNKEKFCNIYFVWKRSLFICVMFLAIVFTAMVFATQIYPPLLAGAHEWQQGDISSEASFTNTQNGFAGGTGTAQDPFLISTANQLNNIRQYEGLLNEGHYFRLTNNIDLTDFLSYPNAGYNYGLGWQPIGTNHTADHVFNSNLDGAGYTISGLWINRPNQSNIGLFGYLHGTVNNLNIVLDKRGIVGRSPVGAIAGVVRNATQNTVTLNNLSASGRVFGHAYWGSIYLGGLFGRMSGTLGRTITLQNSQFTGSLYSQDITVVLAAGGISGEIWNASIVNSLTNVNISQRQNALHTLAGGLSGRFIGTNNITNSFVLTSTPQIEPFLGRLLPFGAVPFAVVTNSFYYAAEGFISPDTLSHSICDNSRRIQSDELANLSDITGWDFTNTWGFDYDGNLVLRQFGQAYDPTRVVTVNITGTGAEGVTHDAPDTILQMETVLQFTLTGASEDATITLPYGGSLSGMTVTVSITAGEAVITIDIIITAFVPPPPPPPNLTWLWILLGVIGGLLITGGAVFTALKLRKPKTITETIEIEKEIIVERETIISIPIIKKTLPSDLSEKEKIVADLILKGKTRREIADILDISEGTVASYSQRLFTKTGVNGIKEFIYEYLSD